MKRRFQSILLLAFSALLVAADKPTSPASSELKETIAQMDMAMFDALNAHDVDHLMALFTQTLSSITTRMA